MLPIQRKQKSKRTDIILYNYADELYKEILEKDIFFRLKEVPQLGPIRVKQKFSKSRYDYIMLQLYIHKVIRNDLNSELEFSYNNRINIETFMKNPIKINKKDRPTIGDILQILTIIYNIGHFYNTFTSSRAVIMYANENKKFRNLFINSSRDERFQYAAKEYIKDRNYHRLHLLNSILILERCNQELTSIKIAQELIYAYIDKTNLEQDIKLHYIFEVFKKVRDISYISFDLQVSNIPLTIELHNKDSLILILREFLSFYNDQKPIEELFNSSAKLLNDMIYNENSNAICYYQMSKKMVNSLNKVNIVNYYDDIWRPKNSIINKKYTRTKDYENYQILKLTFDKDEKTIAQDLLYELDHTSNISVGYYDRYSGEMTVLVSIRKRCLDKKTTAFVVLGKVIKHLRNIESIRPNDIRFLLVTKFFLYYFFNENRINLETTVDDKTCVLCTRGKTKRINELKYILEKNIGTYDSRHEVKFMIECLNQDNKNDISITLPSSILLLEKDKQIKKICEFDGMIIHPNRKNNQIILLEAKNTSKARFYAKKCLSEKLDKLSINHNKEDIKSIGFNAMLEVSI